jgi:chromosome segregation ATPase
LEPIAHWPQEAGINFVDEVAGNAGLRRLAISPGVDARFGQALYVRLPLDLGSELGNSFQALVSTREELSVLAAAHESQCAHTAVLQSELDQTRVELARERSEKASISAVLSALRGELVAARQQREVVPAQAAGAEAEKENLLATIEDLTARVLRLEPELAAAQETIVKVTAERDLARVTAVSNASERTVLINRATDAEGQLAEKTAALAAAENQCSQLRGALVVQQDQRGQMDEVREEMARAEAQLDLIKEFVGLRPRP